MTPSECFGVVVRTFGLITSLAGLLYLLSLVNIWATPNRVADPRAYLVAGGVMLSLGLFLLRGANVLVRFSYPAEGTRAQERNE